jgi:hypothetical protein
MIEEVEGLGAEIQTEALAEAEFLLQSRVDLVVSGPARSITPQVAPGPFGRQHECRGIEPVVDGLISGINRDTRHQVGALSTGVAIRKLAGTPPDGDVHRTARASCCQAGKLPSAKQRGKQAVAIHVPAPRSPGKFINGVGGHGVANVVRRTAAVASPARHVLERDALASSDRRVRDSMRPHVLRLP